MKKAMLFIAVAVSALSLNAQTVYVPNGTSGIGTSSNGNVGVGTSSPQSKLDVNGQISSSDEIRSNLSGLANFRMVSGLYGSFLRNDGADTYILLTNSGNQNGGWNNLRPFRINNSTGDTYLGGEHIIFHNDGNVFVNGNIGLGTNSPLAKLHVNSGANSTYASILATSDEGNNLVVSSFSTQPTNIKVFSLTHEYFNSSSCRNNGAINFYRGGSDRGGFLTFDSDGQERLRIAASGSVGIGTTAPDQKLTVKGKIHAEEVIVDLNVPLADYVFGKDYELMPLHQVDQYVQENSHLPDMPSATEVKEKGMGVGEMQNKMLQKIEELTLYVIQQDKRIKALEEENQRLKK